MATPLTRFAYSKVVLSVSPAIPEFVTMPCMQDESMPQTMERYEAALDFLYEFVNYERKMTEVYAPEKMDPSRPARLLRALGEPHRHFPSIHIAGTKGKGSVAAMCATALRAAGLNVGLYTSPHLRDLRERIRILTPDDDQGYIAHEAFVALVDDLREVTERMPGLTWFELMTAMAFMHFARNRVDVAVVEVGLGGRLDATNVLTPLVSVITSLSLDHTGLLGNTLGQIAAEKGGIIKDGVPVICASQTAEAMNVIRRIAAYHDAPLSVVGETWQFKGKETFVDGNCCAGQTITITHAPHTAPIAPRESFSLALSGSYQQENAVLALATLSAVSDRFPDLDIEAMRRGLSEVQWPGRLQTLHRGNHTPTLLVDGAHNADSAQKLAEHLQRRCRYERLWLVLGVTADKNVPGILQPLLPVAAGTVVTRADNPRATDPQILRETAGELGYAVDIEPDIAAAVIRAWSVARPADLICVSGSLYIVGDLLNCWEGLKSRLIGVRAPS